MVDTASILSSATGTDQQDDPLSEMSDEQLFQLVEDTK